MLFLHKLLFTLLLFGNPNNLMTSVLHIWLRKSESWLFYSTASSPVASQPSLLHIESDDCFIPSLHTPPRPCSHCTQRVFASFFLWRVLDRVWRRWDTQENNKIARKNKRPDIIHIHFCYQDWCRNNVTVTLVTVCEHTVGWVHYMTAKAVWVHVGLLYSLEYPVKRCSICVYRLKNI